MVHIVIYLTVIMNAFELKNLVLHPPPPPPPSNLRIQSAGANSFTHTFPRFIATPDNHRKSPKASTTII